MFWCIRSVRSRRKNFWAHAKTTNSRSDLDLLLHLLIGPNWRNTHPLVGLHVALAKPRFQAMNNGADDPFLGTVELLETRNGISSNIGLRGELCLRNSSFFANGSTMQGQFDGLAELLVGTNVSRVLREFAVESVEIHRSYGCRKI